VVEFKTDDVILNGFPEMFENPLHHANMAGWQNPLWSGEGRENTQEGEVPDHEVVPGQSTKNLVDEINALEGRVVAPTNDQ
jgi:hypothetical protein